MPVIMAGGIAAGREMRFGLAGTGAIGSGEVHEAAAVVIMEVGVLADRDGAPRVGQVLRSAGAEGSVFLM
jgi:hypothetical protein